MKEEDSADGDCPYSIERAYVAELLTSKLLYGSVQGPRHRRLRLRAWEFNDLALFMSLVRIKNSRIRPIVRPRTVKKSQRIVAHAWGVVQRATSGASAEDPVE